MKLGLREIVFLVLLMVIPVGAWWFVFRPQDTSNAKMKQEIQARQAKLDQLNMVLKAKGDLESQIDSLSQAISFFESRLPQEKEIDQILREVWLLAEANKLKAKSIRTLVRKGAGGFISDQDDQSEQPIQVQLEGDFMGFYAFLLALEKQPRIMRISRMTLETDAKIPTGRIAADFELSVFFEKSDKEESWAQKS